MVQISTSGAIITCRQTNHGIVFAHLVVDFANVARAVVRSLSLADAHTNHTGFAHAFGIIQDIFQAIGDIHIGGTIRQGTHHNIRFGCHAHVSPMCRTYGDTRRVGAVRARIIVVGERSNGGGIEFSAG